MPPDTYPPVARHIAAQSLPMPAPPGRDACWPSSLLVRVLAPATLVPAGYTGSRCRDRPVGSCTHPSPVRGVVDTALADREHGRAAGTILVPALRVMSLFYRDARQSQVTGLVDVNC